jgi:hypothetical protein
VSHEALNPEQFSEERECADAPCGQFEPDPHLGAATCKNCLWSIGAHSSKAGGPSGHGKDKLGGW